MEQHNEFDLWIDRSTDQLLKLMSELDVTDPSGSTSKLREIPIFQGLPPHAEASDFLSINEWMEAGDGSPSI